MASSEPNGGSPRVDVIPVVVVVCHAEMANVLIAVVVGVADQGCLPVVVEKAVGDSDEVRGMSELSRQLICIIRTVDCLHQPGRRNNPYHGHGQKRDHSGQSRHWSRILLSLVATCFMESGVPLTNANGVAIISKDLPDSKIANDDVRLLLHQAVSNQ